MFAISISDVGMQFERDVIRDVSFNTVKGVPGNY